MSVVNRPPSKLANLPFLSGLAEEKLSEIGSSVR